MSLDHLILRPLVHCSVSQQSDIHTYTTTEMGVGRALCVSLPFILTAISLVTLLIVGLAGVTGSNISLFEVVPKDLSISLADLQSLTVKKQLSAANLPINVRGDLTEVRSTISSAIDAASNINITAAQLNLADKYNFYLWNFVEVRGNVTTKTAPRFDYASNFTNTSSITNLAAGTGLTISIPGAVQSGLSTFANLIKWTQVVFIIAGVATIITILVGIVAFFSRIGSCITWIMSAISTAAIVSFATLATITSTSVVGILNSAAGSYGVHSSVNTSWLVIIWIGVAAAIASGLFWLFTICCCASSSGRSGKRHSRGGDSEKVIGGKGYQPVHDPFRNEPYVGQQSGIYNQQQYAIPMNNVKTSRAQAYEPYAHHAV